jgi:hypothetical protein
VRPYLLSSKETRSMCWKHSVHGANNMARNPPFISIMIVPWKGQFQHFGEEMRLRLLWETTLCDAIVIFQYLFVIMDVVHLLIKFNSMLITSVVWIEPQEMENITGQDLVNSIYFPAILLLYQLHTAPLKNIIWE